LREYYYVKEKHRTTQPLQVWEEVFSYRQQALGGISHEQGLYGNSKGSQSTGGKA